MAADVAQRESNSIKRYAPFFLVKENFAQNIRDSDKFIARGCE